MRALTVALAIVIISNVFSTKPTLALSPNDIRGQCKSEYQKWKKRAGYGAFAYSRTTACGFAWENTSMATARRQALQVCAKRKKAKDCEIIAENDKPSSYVQKINQCESSTGDAKVDACTYLVEHKRKGYEHAWNYNERGRAYQALGKTDLAIADYTGALREDKRYGWSLMNRARLRRDAFDFEYAISDARAALKFYRSGGDDYRQEAKELISGIEFEMRRQRPDDNSRLCTLALTPRRDGWDRPHYSIAVREAERRGLTVEKCQNLQGQKP